MQIDEVFPIAAGLLIPSQSEERAFQVLEGTVMLGMKKMTQPTEENGPERVSPGLELGRRIRLLREMVGLNQQQLADRVGISRSAVAFWETGRSGHVGKHLGALAEALGVDAEVLLTGMAYKEIQETLTPDESMFLNLYRQLSPLIKLQAQKWVERRVRQAEEAAEG